MKRAEAFIAKVRRLSALDSYLSSFCGGISTFTKDDDILHVRLVQHMTATGRLASREPNLQNMPRGGTFPVKRVFKSRWEGGQIMEADFAQLEFRVAAYLSQDGVAIEEVLLDLMYTHTPLRLLPMLVNLRIVRLRRRIRSLRFIGATGFGRTPAEAEYYSHFNEKYEGIAAWHSRLATEALTTKKIRTPSWPRVQLPRGRAQEGWGRQLLHPDQELSCAELYCGHRYLVLIMMEDAMREQGLQSLIVNTVHDSS